jgi:hypothetical protein
MSLLDNLMRQKADARRAELHKSLLHRHAKLGGQLFGPIPVGNRREFFCLDEHTWVWHEEWTDQQTRQRHAVTTRYDVRPNGVLKSQGNNSYQQLSVGEAQNLRTAVRRYHELVSADLQQQMAA